jgi:hypothetical protein
VISSFLFHSPLFLFAFSKREKTEKKEEERGRKEIT